MNIPRRFFLRPATFGLICLSVAFCPLSGRAQQNKKGRNRPAARPVASPSPQGAVAPLTTSDPETKESSPPSDAPADATVTETEIDASDGATFASKERIAVFAGNVRVTDPRFQLSCDKLTVFLNKSTPPVTAGSTAPGVDATPEPAAAAGNTPPAPAAKGQGGGGGIDHVVAEGHVIIMQKRPATKPGEEEKVSIGRGSKGTFENKTGDMTLYGMPSIEQNGNKHAATSSETVMIIHKDSSLDTKGPSSTTLIQRKGSSGIQMPGDFGAPGGKNKRNGNGAGPQTTPGT